MTGLSWRNYDNTLSGFHRILDRQMDRQMDRQTELLIKQKQWVLVITRSCSTSSSSSSSEHDLLCKADNNWVSTCGVEAGSINFSSTSRALSLTFNKQWRLSVSVCLCLCVSVCVCQCTLDNSPLRHYQLKIRMRTQNATANLTEKYDLLSQRGSDVLWYSWPRLGRPPVQLTTAGTSSGTIGHGSDVLRYHWPRLGRRQV